MEGSSRDVTICIFIFFQVVLNTFVTIPRNDQKSSLSDLIGIDNNLLLINLEIIYASYSNFLVIPIITMKIAQLLSATNLI